MESIREEIKANIARCESEIARLQERIDDQKTTLEMILDKLDA